MRFSGNFLVELSKCYVCYMYFFVIFVEISKTLIKYLLFILFIFIREIDLTPLNTISIRLFNFNQVYLQFEQIST